MISQEASIRSSVSTSRLAANAETLQLSQAAPAQPLSNAPLRPPARSKSPGFLPLRRSEYLESLGVNIASNQIHKKISSSVPYAGNTGGSCRSRSRWQRQTRTFLSPASRSSSKPLLHVRLWQAFLKLIDPQHNRGQALSNPIVSQDLFAQACSTDATSKRSKVFPSVRYRLGHQGLSQP